MKRLTEFFGGSNDRAMIAEFLREKKTFLIKAAAVIAVIAAAVLVFAPGGEEEDGITVEDSAAQTEAAVSVSKVYVDIGGAVKTPMVAELDEGSRIQDAIEAAGGLTDKADIAEINRAAFIEDGDKIYIPFLTEDGEGDGTGDSVSGEYQSRGAAAYNDGRININTADSVELQELDGVGPATAEKIISYREENGRFKDAEDLKNVSGIGDKTFEKLKDRIKV